MGREAGFGVNRLSTKRVHHTAKNARFHGYRMDTAPAKQVLLLLVWLVLLLQRSRLKRELSACLLVGRCCECQRHQKERLCHKSVLMTGTPMASSKSWRGFAAPPVRSKNRNHAR